VFRAKLDSADRFTAADDATVAGSILPDHTHLTDALLEESAIELDITCTCSSDQSVAPSSQRRAKFAGRTVSCSLSITLYGTMELFELVGKFFQSNDVYLQDPQCCERNVRYCNPHRLSFSDLDSCIRTSELGQHTAQLVELAQHEPASDLLGVLESQMDLPETEQPARILTTMAKSVQNPRRKSCLDAQ
jgi:hypothetical protein